MVSHKYVVVTLVTCERILTSSQFITIYEITIIVGNLLSAN